MSSAQFDSNLLSGTTLGSFLQPSTTNALILPGPPRKPLHLSLTMLGTGLDQVASSLQQLADRAQCS